MLSLLSLWSSDDEKVGLVLEWSRSCAPGSQRSNRNRRDSEADRRPATSRSIFLSPLSTSTFVSHISCRFVTQSVTSFLWPTWRTKVSVIEPSPVAAFLPLPVKRPWCHKLLFFLWKRQVSFRRTYVWHWVKLVQLINWCWIFLGRNF